MSENDSNKIITEYDIESDDISNNSNVFISSSSNLDYTDKSDKMHNKKNINNDIIYENETGNNPNININNNNNKKNATNGIYINSDIYSNDMPDFIDSDKSNNSSNSNDETTFSENRDESNTKPKKKLIKTGNKLTAIHNEGNLIEEMLELEKNEKIINGWDSEAIKTIRNWYKIFKQQSWIYQYILDRNLKISDWLGIISICMNALLGIFCAFKLWINDDIFQIVSNIILIFSNFFIGLLTAISKRYIDDKRNEEIRTYINEVDVFFGEISAQVLKHPVYRMNADKFFRINNDKYTSLVSKAPNLSIIELNLGKKMYKKMILHNDLDKHIFEKESNNNNV
jgi:hypothetical protein